MARKVVSGIGYWWSGLGLRGKLIATILAPALVVIGGLYMYSIQGMLANFDREHRERALAVAQTLQQSIAQGDLEDTTRLSAILHSLVAGNPTLYRLSVYGLRGGQPIVLASSDSSLVGRAAGLDDLDPMRTGQTVLLERREGQVPLVEAGVPLAVGGAPIAAIGVYMSLGSRDALLRAQQVSLLLIGGGGLVLMLALVYFLTERLIVVRVGRISQAASRIANGQLETKVPELGQDEVGRLASSVSVMVEELLEDRRALERLATTDGLTELWNHRCFHERLRQELSRASRLKEPLSLIMLDLDRFKAFNDAYGHLKGDEALRTVGNILRTLVRPYDVPCRYGGEEFIVIVPGADAQGARELAERIRRRIASQDFGDDQRATITGSFGISSYPKDDTNPDPLVRAADMALYAAKRAGGNTVRIYDRLEVGASQDPTSLDEMFRKASLGALQAVAMAADAREANTGGHSLAVTGYVRDLGGALGLAHDAMDILEAAALLHDVGKIGIPEGVLSKPGSLTEKEWELVRAHSVLGGLMVKRVSSLSNALSAIPHHHERWDGAGYPDGLKGEEIPLLARMLALADAYEAMTASRPYRKAFSEEQAIEELKKGAGSQFDPRLAVVFIEKVLKRSQGLDQESGALAAPLVDSPQTAVDVDADEHQGGGQDGDVERAHGPA